MSEAENGKEITFDLLFDLANEKRGVPNKVIVSVREAEAKLFGIGDVMTLGQEGTEGEPYKVVGISLPFTEESEQLVRVEMERCRA